MNAWVKLLMGLKSSVLVFVILIVAISYPVIGASNDNPTEVCKISPDDYNKLNSSYFNLSSQYSELNSSYFNLLRQNSELNKSINDLNLILLNRTAERDYYKEQYENSSLNNVSVRDFYLTIGNLIYSMNANYSKTFDEYKTEVNTHFTEINNYVLLLTFFIVLFELVLLKPSIFKFIVRIKWFWINSIYRKSVSFKQSISQNKTVIRIKKVIFVDDENSTHKPDEKK